VDFDIGEEAGICGESFEWFHAILLDVILANYKLNFMQCLRWFVSELWISASIQAGTLADWSLLHKKFFLHRQFNNMGDAKLVSPETRDRGCLV
jgi:hypothetical protein